jgi:DNA-binding transcriptional regulator YiaG
MTVYSTQLPGTGFITQIAAEAIVCVPLLPTPTSSNTTPFHRATERTSLTPSNIAFAPAEPADKPSTAYGILEIRQLANLTWDETAQIFGVSRRTVHLWANGRHPAGEQERKLNRVLGILKAYQNIPASQLRQKLMASAEPGILFFDLLCDNQFEVFQRTFAAPIARKLTAPPARAQHYAPPAPTALLDALQDRPVAKSTAISGKTVRLKRQDS